MAYHINSGRSGRINGMKPNGIKQIGISECGSWPYINRLAALTSFRVVT